MNREAIQPDDSASILGREVGGAERMTLGVIGNITMTASGNTVLEIGNDYPGADGWLKAAHVVLTPSEREVLISRLIAQRNT